jgi:hypothetical protein
MSEEAKRKALLQVAAGKNINFLGKAKYKIGQTIVHVRFCGTDLRRSPKYKFNINPNTLSADYELWICGQADSYYFIPIPILNDIYLHPEAYVDSRHPEIRVVSLDIESHRLTYASGGRWLNIRPYWRAVLE